MDKLLSDIMKLISIIKPASRNRNDLPPFIKEGDLDDLPSSLDNYFFALVDGYGDKKVLEAIEISGEDVKIFREWIKNRYRRRDIK